MFRSRDSRRINCSEFFAVRRFGELIVDEETGWLHVVLAVGRGEVKGQRQIMRHGGMTVVRYRMMVDLMFESLSLQVDGFDIC